MSDKQDPLNTHEHIDPGPNGNFLLDRERNTVRNFIPSFHTENFDNHKTQKTQEIQKTQKQLPYIMQNVPTGIDELPPVQVLLRGIQEEDTPQNRQTIQHRMHETRNTIRGRMNEEILTQKIKYKQLSSTRAKSAQNKNDRSRSLIEDRIRKKSLVLGANDVDFRSVKPYPEITAVRGGIQDSIVSSSKHGMNNTKEDLKEGFTSPGDILGQQEDLLYSNKFDSTRVLKHDHSREFKQKFRRHYEEKREKEEKLDRMEVSNNDPIKTNNLNFSLPSRTISSGAQNISRPGGFGVMPKNSIGNQLTNPHEGDRYNKPRSTLITIDSKDRDVTRYPDANSFKISLGKQFRNVKRVVLVSTEFPNTDLIIRDDPQEAAFERNRILLKCGEVLNDANNHLYWINDEDAVSKGIYECVIYTADLDPGNYTAQENDCECERSLATEIEEKVSNINHFDDGTPHQFIVEINPSTNIVRFLSIESVNLAVNPLTTTVGTNLISISQPDHPFVVGDTVTITGASSVGGISATVLNNEHIIQETNALGYVIRVTQIATSTSGGGGANVLAGENKPIKLLFSNIDSIGHILGFPQEDSSEQIAVDIDFINIDPPDLSSTPLNLNPGTPGTVPARISASSHGLVPGDEILIINTDAIPNINGIQIVTKVITENEFEIGIPIKVVNNQTTTQNTVLGQICQSIDTEFTEITSLSTQLDGNIQTDTPHGFDVGDMVLIGNVVGGVTINNTPVNGIHTVSADISSTCLDITAGVVFEGTDISNAFVFETSSTELSNITALIPQNNGVIEPAALEPIFVGTQVPDFVFFKNMGNVEPNLNGDISGILQVDYYSESTGKFDLTTPIANIFSQTASQQYIRSSDSTLRTITDAFIQSKGTFRLDTPHGLASGNRIYIRSLIPEITSSEPGISPDITGILTINTILDSENFDTTTEIISSLFDTGDIAYIPTQDKTTTQIQNIYPASNNYIAKNINSCKNPNCIMCEDSSIIITDSYLRTTTSNAAVAVTEETTAVTLLNGIRTVSQIFNGPSQNFTHILDLKDVILDVLPLNVEFVSSPIGLSVEHTLTFFYDFSSIMINDPTTGTIVFGGTSQLSLAIDTPYTFEYSPGAGDTTSQIRITTLLANLGPLLVGPLAPGTFYIKSILFSELNSFKSPLGNCFVLKTDGVAPGTNGLNGVATYTEVGDGLIEITTTYSHGLENGDIIYISEEITEEPPLPWIVDNILAPTSGNHDAILEFDFPAFDICISKGFTPFNTPRYTIDGNVLGNGSLLIPNTEDTDTAVIPSSLTAPAESYVLNQLPAFFGFPTVPDITGIQIGDPGGRVQVPLVDTLGAPKFTIVFKSKNIIYLKNTSQTVSVVDATTFQISIGSIGPSGYVGSIEYSQVCGDAFPIKSYFANSWSGLFESQNHLIDETTPSNIYIGKTLEAGTTTLPIDPFAIPDPINGFLGNALGSLTDSHPFWSPLNFHFFSSIDLFTTPIIQEDLNTSTAEFVNIALGNVEVLANIEEITPANTGLIESSLPHGFIGGERLYFLGNVNINNGVSNDLRENFFEVASIDPTDNRRFTINSPITIIGNGNVGAIATGNFFKTPPDETEHHILNIARQTNAVFFCGPDHGLDPFTTSQIFITTNSLTPTNDVFANALAFPNPAPIPSSEQFDSDIVVLATDIGIALGNNKVDIVSTNNALFPNLQGMSWVTAPTSQKIPIVNISRDSSGTLSPVKPGLSIGDTVFIKSLHTTVGDLNGFHQVSYIDLLGGAFFELEDVTISNAGNAIIDTNGIVYFEVQTSDTQICPTINDITTGQCPTIIRASEHGFPIGSNISIFICGTDTNNPINYTDVNIINDVIVIDDDEIQLPFLNNGNIQANLCVNQVFNDTNLFIEQQGKFSKKIMSTNCGDATLTPDPINHQTFVTTDIRKNIKSKVMFEIINSNPIGGGASVITIVLSQGFTTIPWTNGDIIQISGHIGGDPYIDGEFNIFNISTDQFSIIPRPDTSPFSTGGTGGFATGPAPLTIQGHGLITGDKVRFEDMNTQPPIDFEVFTITVVSTDTYSIPLVVEQFNNRCTGFWCSNIVDMEIRDHGLVDNDTFFLYGAECVGGIQPQNLNTIHGQKRMNVPTKEEIRTQKTIRVIDENNIQFSVDSFPSARTLAGGFTVCISSNNHTNDEKKMGLKNYGFGSIQTNQNCLGKSRRFIDLNNESYVLMVSDVLNHLLNTGSVRKIFAKIQLTSKPGEIAYNSFVTTERIFDSPITRIDELDFEIRRSDGKLFDLRGRDYSMSLLVEEYQDKLRNAEISSRRGISDKGRISSIGLIESTISSENPQQNILNPAQFLATTDLTQRAKVPTGFNK